VPTLADELRRQSASPPKVVALSMKPRSAIGLAGHGGDLVLWFDPANGWTTSRAYAQALPEIVSKFSRANPIAVAGTAWTRLLPEKAYQGRDAGLGENPGHGWTPSFPHVFPPATATRAQIASAWEDSPFSDDALAAFAEMVITDMKLGTGPGTDFLAVSFSALDLVGHSFGPRSHEVQDVLVRLDRALGRLLAALDSNVGRDQYMLALTGDHGVSDIPDQLIRMGQDAGRVDLSAAYTAVETVLNKRWGPGSYVATLAYTDFYFRPGVFDRLRADRGAMRAAVDAIAGVPGMARVVRADELVEGKVKEDAVTRAMRLSYYPGRSGDLLFVPRRNWISAGTPATHGTYYDYDERVPLILRGRGIVPGEYSAPSSPADVAPTLASLVGVTLPNPDGHVLTQAFGPGKTQ
jgi:predicted AlkP superfamily pyrophosphatase or phosphodiesterase